MAPFVVLRVENYGNDVTFCRVAPSPHISVEQRRSLWINPERHSAVLRAVNATIHDTWNELHYY